MNNLPRVVVCQLSQWSGHTADKNCGLRSSKLFSCCSCCVMEQQEDVMRWQNIWCYTAQHTTRCSGCHGQISSIKATQDAYGASWRRSLRWPIPPTGNEREREDVTNSWTVLQLEMFFMQLLRISAAVVILYYWMAWNANMSPSLLVLLWVCVMWCCREVEWEMKPERMLLR